MATVSVIYRAPKGDAKVCEWGEFTFFDGVAVEIEENVHTAHMIKKMASNKNFELSEMGTVNKAMDQAALQKPTPVPEPEPDPPPVPEEDPVTESEAAPEHEFEDYTPEPPKPKAIPARAKTPKKTAKEKTVKERVTEKRTRAGW